MTHQFDPDADFIVVRSKKHGRHIHVELRELDKAMENIGLSAERPSGVPSKAISLIAEQLDTTNETLAQVKMELADLKTQFAALKLMAELTLEVAQLSQDDSPTVYEYPNFATHYALTASSTLDEWNQALNRFRKAA